MYAKVQKAQRGAINVPQIWNDDRLSLLEKSLMWVLISKENEFCRLGVKFNITREVLAKCLSTCELSITRAIKTLQELDYIKVEIIKRKNYYTINWDMMNKVQENIDTEKEKNKVPENVKIELKKVEENPLPISSEVENKEEEEVKEVEKLEVMEENEGEGYSLETADDNDYTVILNIAKGENDPDKLKDKERAKAILEEYLQSRPQDREKMMAYLEQMYQEGEVEQGPSIIEKDYWSLNARLDGAVKKSTPLNVFLREQMDDMECAGFSEEEVIEAYNDRFENVA